MIFSSVIHFLLTSQWRNVPQYILSNVFRLILNPSMFCMLSTLKAHQLLFGLSAFFHDTAQYYVSCNAENLWLTVFCPETVSLSQVTYSTALISNCLKVHISLYTCFNQWCLRYLIVSKFPLWNSPLSYNQPLIQI